MCEVLAWASLYCDTCVRVPATLNQIHPLADGPGEATKDGPNTWPLPPILLYISRQSVSIQYVYSMCEDQIQLFHICISLSIENVYF